MGEAQVHTIERSQGNERRLRKEYGFIQLYSDFFGIPNSWNNFHLVPETTSLKWMEMVETPISYDFLCNEWMAMRFPPAVFVAQDFDRPHRPHDPRTILGPFPPNVPGSEWGVWCPNLTPGSPSRRFFEGFFP